MSREALDALKRQIRLLDYLQAHDWRPARRLSRGRFLGLCPLHEDHKPSFLVDPLKNLFYCYGCHRGGDVIRFAELYHQVQFPQALALLCRWLGLPPLLWQTTEFYRMQLHRYSEAVDYVYRRGVRSPEVIEHMRIGYAPGGCLRRCLTQAGYSLPSLQHAGLVSAVTHSCTALCFRSKAISTAAVSRHLRLRTGFCRAPKAAYMAGSAPVNTPP